MASKRLNRHIALGEQMLTNQFPGLSICLDHPLGMSCPGFPGKPCPLNRTLDLHEVFNGWEIGDPNEYTTRCFSCGRKFVPRFTVDYLSLPPSGTSSEATRQPLWCELLSPWALRKEIFSIIFQDGVDALVSPEFRCDSHHAVLFWNAIIEFRLYGLPLAFLLAPVTEAFPPKPVKK